MKIAYCPISIDLQAPGDYRRFIGYCNSTNTKYTVIQNKDLKNIKDSDFDYIVVTMASDLAYWANNTFKVTKIIFDCVDSYVFLNDYRVKNLLRAPAKYFSGQHSSFYFSYINLIRIIARKSYAIVCSTNKQKQFFLNFCKFVHIILDYHSDFITKKKKKFDFKVKDEFNLVWEGLPENICFNNFAGEVIEYINHYNSSLENKVQIKLNVFTDLYFNKFLKKYFLQNSYYYLKKKSHHINFYEWNLKNINEKIIENDLAIIPLTSGNPLEYGKPANKLFLFFKMGMPTITSNTFAYKEVENDTNLKITFENIKEFSNLLELYIQSKEKRKNYSKKAISYINSEMPEKKLSDSWTKVFERR